MNEADMLAVMMLSYNLSGWDVRKKYIVRLSKGGYRAWYRAMKGYYDNKRDIFLLMGYKVKVLPI